MSVMAGVVDFKNGIPALSLIQTTAAARRGESSAPTLIYTDGGETALTYTGRIYNAHELRAELTKRGCTFKNRTDTELILAAYTEWGEQCLGRLLGTFAFALWDSRLRQLFIARDCMGVKPFFYYHSDQRLIFASEIKTLLKHPSIKAEIDQVSVAELILIGPGRTPGYGVFRNIRELPPAGAGCFSEKGLTVSAYWQLAAKKHTESFEETLEHVKHLVNDAIKQQSAAEPPVCAMLSGGLDSSIIAAVSGVKKTFSVDYDENERYFKSSKFQPDSDKKYIDIMTEFLGSDHQTVTLSTDDLVESLFLAVHARDLPGMADVDGSMLLFCRAVKEQTQDIALSGECADELFGGYPWYRDEKTRAVDGFPWSQSTKYRASFLKDGVIGEIDPEQYVYQKYAETVRNSAVLADESALEKRMKELFQLNIQWFMQTLIDRTDRMSGACGLEVRIPFCDRRIAEYAYNIPWAFKEYQGREKGLLRASMAGVLPERVLWRKKSPFPKTHNPRYMEKVSGILSEIIASPGSPIHQLIKKEALTNLITAANTESEQTPWYGQLMTAPQTIAYFIQLNYWLEQYKVSII